MSYILKEPDNFLVKKVVRLCSLYIVCLRAEAYCVGCDAPTTSGLLLTWGDWTAGYILSGTSMPRRAMPLLSVLATLRAMTRRVSFSSSVSAPRML